MSSLEMSCSPRCPGAAAVDDELAVGREDIAAERGGEALPWSASGVGVIESDVVDAIGDCSE